MTNMAQSFSREDLYELVWAKPATHIARELAIKPAAVLKACKLLNIPRPTTGHWVKLEHGQSPLRPALPAVEPGTPVTVTLDEPMRRKKTAKAEALAHSSPASAEEETTKWHVAVQKTKTALRAGTINDKYGTIIPKREHPHLSISISRACIDRALLVLNQLAWRLEEMEFNFKAPEQGKSQFTLIYKPTGTELSFLLKEEVERYERELTPEEKTKSISYIWDRWRHRPTGRLRLLLNEYHPEGCQKSWGEGKNTKLEDKLTDAASGFVFCAQGKHAQHLEWAERDRRWEEAARQRREEEERKKKEDERRAVLVTAAKKWSDAAALKTFRAACEARLRNVSQGGTLTRPQEDWLAWVDLVIEESDPLTSGFLKRLEA
jgi:hypothetical protein